MILAPTRKRRGLFPDRASAEAAYQAAHTRGYTRNDVDLVMSDATRDTHFAKVEGVETELGNKAAEGAGIGGAIGGTIGAIAAAVAAIGTTLGLEVEKKNVTFDAILPGLAADKYDIAISSFTDTKEREETVDMVTYFTAGTGFYTNAENPVEVEGLADLCGKKVAVQKGTVQQEDVEGQNDKCDDPIDVAVFTQQTDVDLAINSGRAEVALADSPVAAYAVQQSDGALKSTGKEYDSAPYGIAVNKENGLTEAIQAAVQAMIDDGTYTAILEEWGQTAGALDESKINDGVE